MNNPTDTNQASELFELCKKVYELTEWQIDDAIWIVGDENGDLFILTKEVEAQGYYDYYTPLYTSDYLLEKLPPFTNLRKVNDGLDGIVYDVTDEYDEYLCRSDTPSKALLKLTIALSEAGELNG